MTPLRLAALAAAAFLSIAARPPEERTIHYKVTPLAPGGYGNALRVEMRFRGDADGETRLLLPSEWAGSDRLWRHALDLEIRGGQRLSGYYDAPVIHHRPGARLTVRYEVVSAWHGEPGFDYEKARPLVRPDFFFVHGEGLFAEPDGRQAADARFRWGRLPRGWTVASDLDHLRGGRTDVANLINSALIGGKSLTVIERKIGDAPLRVAVAGKWKFRPEELADVVEKVVVAENRFWGDPPSPYLVTMAPLGDVPTGLTYTGTGRTDAFTIASTGAFELSHATRFLAHENMHSWVPIELGNMPDDDSVDYWFSEGFNDYLASKVLLGAGLWTLDQWAADKNETLLRYGTSPAKTIAAADIRARFWTDQAVQQVSYDRGHILAAMLDADIAARTGGKESIESVMRAQRAAAKGSSALASDLFRTTLLERTGIDAAPLIERHARAGEAIALSADLLGACGRVETITRRAFSYGFDPRATRIAEGIIAGVDPAGPAHAAGMRNGMTLVLRETGVIGDSSQTLSYRVKDGGEEKIIAYLPEGQAVHQVQRIALAGDDADASACTARLGGGGGVQ